MISFLFLLGAACLAADCSVSNAGSECIGSGEVTVVERTAAVVMCGSGFEYDPDEECCVMEEVTDPKLACETGKQRGGVCAVFSQPQASCPEGFTLEQAGCVRKSKSTMSTACGSGYLSGATCVDRVPVELEYVCPTGCEERDGQCYTTQTFQHSFFCPAGWSRQGDRCILEEVVDCTDASLPGDCGDHCYVDPECTGHNCFGSKAEIQQRLQSRKRRSLSVSLSAHALCNSRPCEVHKMEPRPREESLELLSKTCVKRTETDADVFCDGPQSAIFNGVTCCVEVPVDREPMCPGEGSVHDCYTTVRKPASATCPPGFDKVCRGNSAFGCQCQKEEVVEPEPLCLSGFFEEGSCVVFQDPVAYCPEQDAALVGDICVRYVREPVRLRTELVVECEGQVCLEKMSDVDFETGDDFFTETEKFPDSFNPVDIEKPFLPVEKPSKPLRPVERPFNPVEKPVIPGGPVSVEVEVRRRSRREEKRSRKAERKAIRKARRCAKKSCRRQRRRRCDDCEGQFEIVDEL